MLIGKDGDKTVKRTKESALSNSWTEITTMNFTKKRFDATRLELVILLYLKKVRLLLLILYCFRVNMKTLKHL